MVYLSWPSLVHDDVMLSPDWFSGIHCGLMMAWHKYTIHLGDGISWSLTHLAWGAHSNLYLHWRWTYMVHELSQQHSSIIHDVLILVCLSGPLGHRYSAYIWGLNRDSVVLVCSWCTCMVSHSFISWCSLELGWLASKLFMKHPSWIWSFVHGLTWSYKPSIQGLSHCSLVSMQGSHW